MNLNLEIRSVGFASSPALEAYFREKFARIQRHFDQILNISVTFTYQELKEKEKRQKVAARFLINGKDFFADQVDASMYAAVDLLVGKFDSMIGKHKDCQMRSRHSQAADLYTD